MANSFIRGVGRLATDRYEFQDHIDGYNFRHVAAAIDLDPTVTIDSVERTTLQSAMSAAATAITNLEATSIPDADITGTKGLITLQGGDLAGVGSTAISVKVSGLQGNPISTSTPSTGNVLTWNSGLYWEPAAPAAPSNQFASSGAPFNTGYGYLAGYNIYAGTFNTSMGYEAAKTVSGNYNTAIGSNSLYSITTGSSNTSVGYNSSYSISTGSENSIFGYNAGYYLTTGTKNVIIGTNSCNSTYVTSATESVCIGNYAGRYMSGSARSIFIGSSAGEGNSSGTSTGLRNIGIGYQSLYSYTTGSYNVGLGTNSLLSLNDGESCVAIGYNAMSTATYATGSVGIGYYALSGESNLGIHNIGIGYEAGKYISGSSNIAIGAGSLLGSDTFTTGSNNVCVGVSAGANITTGNYNVAIGYNASCGTTSLRCIAIGADASAYYTYGNIQLGEGSNSRYDPGFINLQVGSGTSGSALYKCYAYEWIPASDERIKEEIKPLTSLEGLELIEALHPVSYYIKYNGNGNKEEYLENRRPCFGLIAQDVKKVMDELGFPKHSVYTDDDEKGWALNYDSLIAPLIKAVQELSISVKELKEDNTRLKVEIELLKTK